MTNLEARIASLEHDLAVLVTVLQDVAISQTLFASLAAKQLQTLIDQVRRMRDEGDEWKDFG